MKPTDSNILPLYSVEEYNVKEGAPAPLMEAKSSSVVNLRDRFPKLVETSLNNEVVFTGDAAIEKATHFRKLFLQRMRLICGRMVQARRLKPILPKFVDNWTLENLGDIVPMYIKYGHDGVPVFNETNFLKTQTDSLLDPSWKGLLERIDGFWIGKENFGNHIMNNLMLVEGDRASRQGFPSGVLQDINFLSGLHKKNFPEIYRETIEDKQNGFARAADFREWKGGPLSLL